MPYTETDLADELAADARAQRLERMGLEEADVFEPLLTAALDEAEQVVKSTDTLALFCLERCQGDSTKAHVMLGIDVTLDDGCREQTAVLLETAARSLRETASRGRVEL